MPISSIIFSRNTSAGVFHPKHLRGVLLSWSQICLMSLSVMPRISRLRGSQRLARRLVFSTVPFCQGDEGSQNQVWVPNSACRCGQLTNSEPRSNVMDRRATRGRSLIAFVISPGSGKRPTRCLEKTKRPSTTTSKTPSLPLMSFESAPKLDFSSSARPAARGW